MQIDVARAESDDDLRELIVVRKAVHPEATPALENMRHHLRISPGSAYFLARVEGQPVGCGFCGGFPGAEDGPHVRADASVLAEHRRRGVGTALARAVSEHARSLGKEGLTVEAREDIPEASEFLEKRGYVEVERQKAVALELQGVELPEPAPPEGVRIVTRAERPDLERGRYEVGLEAGRDIPGLDSDNEQTFEEWRSFEIERPSRPPEWTFVALAGDEVIGYAALEAYGKVASHGLTAVRRDWRRRGVARALKLSQLRAAQAAGFERALTESEERNEPMRRLNESLGFRPIPGMIVYRGPLMD
jgi:GNAT superfamily N-acetyltransferase